VRGTWFRENAGKMRVAARQSVRRFRLRRDGLRR
jgi:hypothetical protein